MKPTPATLLAQLAATREADAKSRLCVGHIATRTLDYDVPCVVCPGYGPRGVA